MKSRIKLIEICIIIGIMAITGYYYFSSFGKISKISANSSYELMKANDSISQLFDKSMRVMDSLIPSAKETVAKLYYYDSLSQAYKSQVDSIKVASKDVVIVVDSTEIVYLRDKLESTEREVTKLKLNLTAMIGKVKADSMIIERFRRPVVITPPLTVKKEEPVDTIDSNSIVISINPVSRKKDTIPLPSNLVIYLIPVAKGINKLAVYDLSCDESLIRRFSGYKLATYSKGGYFFPNVLPGKYLVKVCYYYGDFKYVTKGIDKLTVSLQLSPPIQ